MTTCAQLKLCAALAAAHDSHCGSFENICLQGTTLQRRCAAVSCWAWAARPAHKPRSAYAAAPDEPQTSGKSSGSQGPYWAAMGCYLIGLLN